MINVGEYRMLPILCHTRSLRLHIHVALQLFDSLAGPLSRRNVAVYKMIRADCKVRLEAANRLHRTLKRLDLSTFDVHFDEVEPR